MKYRALKLSEFPVETKTPVILAFMQNQWFKDPVRMEKLFNRHPYNGDRQLWIKTWLFYTCLSGKRLESAFGDDVDQIIWEEASPKIGGVASAKFKADIEHITAAIVKFQPTHVITFGRIATDGVVKALGKAAFAAIQQDDKPYLRRPYYSGFEHYAGPHPTARFQNPMLELKLIADKVKRILHPELFLSTGK